MADKKLVKTIKNESGDYEEQIVKGVGTIGIAGRRQVKIYELPDGKLETVTERLEPAKPKAAAKKK